MIFFLFTTVLFSQTAYEKGKAVYKAKACYSCHGHKLEGMNTFPRLANRAKGFLAYKLTKFRLREAATQAEEMMITYSIDLSDEDIQNLATYMNEYVDEEVGESYDYSFQTHGDGGS